MLENPREGRSRGRQKEATENDARILAAALEVLIADPRAPIAQVAARAGVGIGSLYRRFSGRDELARRLAAYAMGQIEQVARDAHAGVQQDAWAAFVGFLERAMDVGAGSLTAFAGTFTAGAELNAAAQRMIGAIDELVGAVRAAGAVRADLTTLDVLQLFEMLRAVRVGDAERTIALRNRYIALLSPALRPDSAEPVAHAPPTWHEVAALWNP